VLILAILGLALVIGMIANVILGGRNSTANWGELLIAAFIGSLVGGLLSSLIAGDGLALKFSGLIGSVIGAIIVLLMWRGIKSSRSKKHSAHQSSGHQGSSHNNPSPKNVPNKNTSKKHK